ncbi:MAG: hypothetical protein HYZ20_14405 [Burkholderiales bacterium]|nr:hypothetical protein [Burkholderiales bacterium]
MLRQWLVAHGEDQLSASVAQVALRVVVEDMLNGWVDSPEAAAGDELMFAVALVELAERALWAGRMAFDDDRISSDVAAVVQRALAQLDGIALPAAMRGDALGEALRAAH